MKEEIDRDPSDAKTVLHRTQKKSSTEILRLRLRMTNSQLGRGGFVGGEATHKTLFYDASASSWSVAEGPKT